MSLSVWMMAMIWSGRKRRRKAELTDVIRDMLLFEEQKELLVEVKSADFPFTEVWFALQGTALQWFQAEMTVEKLVSGEGKSFLSLYAVLDGHIFAYEEPSIVLPPPSKERNVLWWNDLFLLLPRPPHILISYYSCYLSFISSPIILP